MSSVALVLLSLSLSWQETPKEFGWIEFSRDPRSAASLAYSIKVFAVLDEKNRVRYIDEIGASGSRTLTLKAPVGTHHFVVVLQPNERTSRGAPTDPVRRRRPNVTLEVEAGKYTPVTIGGFTDFQRAPSQSDTTGTRFVQTPDDPEASQFRTQIKVGEPTEVKNKQ